MSTQCYHAISHADVGTYASSVGGQRDGLWQRDRELGTRPRRCMSTIYHDLVEGQIHQTYFILRHSFILAVHYAAANTHRPLDQQQQ